MHLCTTYCVPTHSSSKMIFDFGHDVLKFGKFYLALGMVLRTPYRDRQYWAEDRLPVLTSHCWQSITFHVITIVSIAVSKHSAAAEIIHAHIFLL